MSERTWWTSFTEISDDMVRASRRYLGQTLPIRNQWNTEVTRDTIFHAAVGIGDDNPLWLDEQYAANSRWGCRLAPPAFVQSLAYGTRYPEDRKGEKLTAMLTGMPGIGSFWIGGDATWYGPLREGDTLRSYATPLAVVDSGGPEVGDRVEADVDIEGATSAWQSFMGSWWDSHRSVLAVTECAVYREPEHTLAVRFVYYAIRVPRGLPVEDGPYSDIPMPVYSEADVAKIFESDLNEHKRRRGNQPLSLDDVQLGDAIPGVVRGPLTPTTYRAIAAGVGSNFAMGDVLLHRFLVHSPSANTPHEITNVPDVPNRIHWDTDVARTLGMPRGYDFGIERFYLTGSYLTDWMGDDAYLHRLTMFFPTPWFLWEVVNIEGAVRSKTAQGNTGPTITVGLSHQIDRMTPQVGATGTAEIVVAR